jgi:tetratricopeptide (TPR) repeat protein
MLRILFSLFALPLLVLEIAVIRHHPFTLWALANAALFPLVGYASIALHEAGHALVARALGLDVPRVQVGTGRELLVWRTARTRLSLHALPFLGMTLVGAKSIARLRLRFWLIVLAGPLVSLAVAAAAGFHFLPTPAMTARFAPLDVLGFYNALIFIGNLVPITLLRRRALQQNDGAQLLTLPFQSAEYVALLLETTSQVQVMDALDADDLPGARRIAEAELARRPGSWGLRSALGTVLLAEARHAEARALYLELVAAEPPRPPLRLVARNNLAWADFMLADESLREEADRDSAAVHAALPRVPFALGTRGAVLGWLGRHDEALGLIERAYLMNSERRMRALNAACAAISHAALGRGASAAMWLERAHRLHPRCPLVIRARLALAALTTPAVTTAARA